MSGQNERPDLHDVRRVENLMAELNVNLYDLEVAGHIDDLVDDDEYTINQTEAFIVATARIDHHHQLGDDYALLHSRQRDVVTDVLARWRR